MTTAPNTVSIDWLGAVWDQLFFAPRDTRMLDVMRIAYAALMTINLLVLAPDLGLWFGESSLVPIEAGERLVDDHSLSLFRWLPEGNSWVLVAYGLLFAHTVLFGLGWLPRVQALGILVWYTTFNHRLIWLWDGEDTLFRLLAFLFILCPLGRHWSIDRTLRISRGDPVDDGPRVAWGLTLIQIQMTLIYVSTAWEKLDGGEWIDGTALYYVSRLDDVFGRFPVVDAAFEHSWSIRLLTWTVLATEVVLPVALWLRETRRSAVVVGVLLHLGIDYVMVLFLFQWLMIVGLLSFVEFEDLRTLRRRLRSRYRPRPHPVPGAA